MNPIGISDYLTALEKLRTEDRDGRIAAILGLAPATSEAPPRAARASEGTTPPRRLLDRGAGNFGLAPVGASEPLPADVPSSDDGWFLVAAPPRTPPGPRDLPRLPPAPARPRPVPHTPLFAPVRARAILAAAVASAQPTGEVDDRALVERAAKQLPIIRIPRRLRLTLARGVHLVVDVGEWMRPFYRDQMELLTDIEQLVSDGRVEVETVRRHPLELVSSSDSQPFCLASRGQGVPVLALTDLGVRQARAGSNEVLDGWLELSRRLRRARLPLLALSPYPVETFPPRVRQSIAIIQWDRATSVAAVHRAATAGRRRCR